MTWHPAPSNSLPPRSVLAPLVPTGLGTPLAVSMTGYLTQLADLHRLGTATLLQCVIAAAIGRPDVAGLDDGGWGRHFAAYVRRPPASLNGVGLTGETWAAGLSAVTLRDDVRRLPMPGWRNVLSAQGMLVAERRYCAVHLEEWRATNQPVYEPLLWQFTSLNACADHGVPLQTACPNCGQARMILSAYGRPGYCHNRTCEAWLGRHASQSDALSEPDLSWARFAERELGSLVAVNGSLSAPVPAGSQVRSVHTAIDLAGSMSTLADRVGFSVSDVSLWAAGRRRPSLDAVLRVCRASGLALVPFLGGELDPRATDDDAEAWVLPRRASHRWIDWREVAAHLGAAAGEAEPPSIARVVAELGLDPRQVRAAIPDAYLELRDRHAAWRRVRIADERAREERVLDDTIRDLVREGIYPSKHQVMKRAGDSLPNMRDRALDAQWRATLLALGIPLRRHPFGPRT